MQGTTHGERQVERRFVSGLLWPHISPLQMNINKELLISAACTVCEYVCMQGRHGGAVWTSRPPPLASPPSPPLPHNPYRHHFLLFLPPPHAHSDFSLFHDFFVFLVFFFFFFPLTCLTPAFVLPVYHGSLCFKEGCWCRSWRWFCHKPKQSDIIFSCLSSIWYISYWYYLKEKMYHVSVIFSNSSIQQQ